MDVIHATAGSFAGAALGYQKIRDEFLGLSAPSLWKNDFRVSPRPFTHLCVSVFQTHLD
jgi:hypothetical protein